MPSVVALALTSATLQNGIYTFGTIIDADSATPWKGPAEASLKVRARFAGAGSAKIKLVMQTDVVSGASMGFSSILLARQGSLSPGALAEHEFDPGLAATADVADPLDQREWFRTVETIRSGRVQVGALSLGAPVVGDRIEVLLSWGLQ